MIRLKRRNNRKWRRLLRSEGNEADNEGEAGEGQEDAVDGQESGNGDCLRKGGCFGQEASREDSVDLEILEA